MAETRDLDQALGSRIRERRKSSHVSQADLARTVGLSRASISNIENGRQPLTVHTLWKIARAVGASAKDLLPNAAEFQEPAVTAEALAPAEKNWIKEVEGVLSA